MSETLYLGTDEIRASAGKFRTTRRYLRAVATGGVTVLAQSKTIDVLFNSAGNVTWRYSVDGYVLEHTNAGASTFDATVQDVTL